MSGGGVPHWGLRPPGGFARYAATVFAAHAKRSSLSRACTPTLANGTSLVAAGEELCHWLDVHCVAGELQAAQAERLLDRGQQRVVIGGCAVRHMARTLAGHDNGLDLPAAGIGVAAAE